mmetsp:Transcript_23382/g.67383  ORF Transcript_23382/g.67383 Transcript_23382/m.67383 type:complete len:436 (-) Transcript_23382:60-1367(-)
MMMGWDAPLRSAVRSGHIRSQHILTRGAAPQYNTTAREIMSAAQTAQATETCGDSADVPREETNSNDGKQETTSVAPSTATHNKRPLDNDDNSADDEHVSTKHNKRAKHHIGGDFVVKELLCPITRELPIDPVTAEDGCTYELAAIKQHFRENPVTEPGSPTTAGGHRRESLSLRLAGAGVGMYEYWRNVLDYVLGSFSLRLGGFSLGVGGERLQQQRDNVGLLADDAPKRKLPKVRSPMTRTIMGQNLLPAIHVRNTIRHLIEVDVIHGDYADAWKKGMETKQMVEDYVKKADGGDVSVMWEVGQWHFHGRHCFDVDKKLGFRLFKRAADANDVKGMASAGSCLVEGWGTTPNICEGFLLTGLAAGLGSDLASWNLACWYHFGHVTVEADKEKAMYYYGKVTDGSCSVRHLNEYLKSVAKTRLAKLQARRLSMA